MPRQKLLVIGGRGFVGSCLAAIARDRFEVAAAGPHKTPRVAHLADLTQPDTLASLFDAVQPDLVALTGAMANIDLCQREPDLAEAINHRGAAVVARLCQSHGARLLFTSTDAVFTGRDEPYSEDDKPTPLNHYGVTKARAEESVLRECPSAVVIRLSLVMGRSVEPDTNSFLDNFAAALAAGRPTKAPAYETRNPIDIRALAELMIELLSSPNAAGIYHAGSYGAITRAELALRLAADLSYDSKLVEPVAAPPADRVPRGGRVILATGRWATEFHTPIPQLDDAIRSSLQPVA